MKKLVTRVSDTEAERMLEKSERTGQAVYGSDEKIYILLLIGSDEKGDFKNFEIVTGRKETFDYLKNLLDAYNDYGTSYLDIEESKILIDGKNISLEEAATVKSFMTYAAEKLDIAFDISNYDKIK